MIELTRSEILWIKTCKGHFDEQNGTTDASYVDKLKPAYREEYLSETEGDDRANFLECMFIVLYDIALRVTDVQNPAIELRNVMRRALFDRFGEEPRVQAIFELVRLIRFSKALDDQGNPRYSLD